MCEKHAVIWSSPVFTCVSWAIFLEDFPFKNLLSKHFMMFWTFCSLSKIYRDTLQTILENMYENYSLKLLFPLPVFLQHFEELYIFSHVNKVILRGIKPPKSAIIPYLMVIFSCCFFYSLRNRTPQKYNHKDLRSFQKTDSRNGCIMSIWLNTG